MPLKATEHQFRTAVKAVAVKQTVGRNIEFYQCFQLK